MSRTARGADVFDTHYRKIFGDRWDRLREAFSEKPRYVEVQYGSGPTYYLDEASRAAASALEIVPGMTAIDLCAAPGGKTLILAGCLAGHGRLVSNERSRNRRERLKRVIEEHLPRSMRSTISVTGHDATRWLFHEQSVYDAALLDVPCSAERHLVERESELSRWTPSRTVRLAAQGYAMLASTLEIVKPGGVIVYSTCTLSPVENDDVVSKLLKKRAGRVEVERVPLDFGEETDTGTIVLPDRDGGRGPLFFARLRRIA